MKTILIQNRKQLYKKIDDLTKNHKPANHYQNDTNPLFELADSSHFMDSKKIEWNRQPTPRKLG